MVFKIRYMFKIRQIHSTFLSTMKQRIFQTYNLYINLLI